MINTRLSGNVLRIARVTAVHPEAHAIDVIYLDDATRASGVQLLSPWLSSRHGVSALPSVGTGGDDPKSPLPRDPDILVVIAMLGTQPIALGCLPPQACDLLFQEAGLSVQRHPSGVYWYTDAGANTGIVHPGGSATLGTLSGKRDLAGADYDARFEESPEQRVTATITLLGGHVVRIGQDTDLDAIGGSAAQGYLDGYGDETGIMARTTGGLTLSSQAGMTLRCDRTAAIVAGVDADIKADSNLNAQAGETVRIEATTIRLVADEIHLN